MAKTCYECNEVFTGQFGLDIHACSARPARPEWRRCETFHFQYRCRLGADDGHDYHEWQFDSGDVHRAPVRLLAPLTRRSVVDAVSVNAPVLDIGFEQTIFEALSLLDVDQSVSVTATRNYDMRGVEVGLTNVVSVSVYDQLVACPAAERRVRILTSKSVGLDPLQALTAVARSLYPRCSDNDALEQAAILLMAEHERVRRDRGE